MVIGKTARFVQKERALDYVYGYTIINDASARDFQFHTSQWGAGKMGDTLAPVGPYIADRVGDPRPARARSARRGSTARSCRTATRSNFIFDVGYIIQYLTNIMTLSPGDLIATGTPAGVGFSRKPQITLQPGDKVQARDHRARHAREPRQGRLSGRATAMPVRSLPALRARSAGPVDRAALLRGLRPGGRHRLERRGAPAPGPARPRQRAALRRRRARRLHHLCYGAPGEDFARVRESLRRAGVAEMDPPAGAPEGGDLDPRPRRQRGQRPRRGARRRRRRAAGRPSTARATSSARPSAATPSAAVASRRASSATCCSSLPTWSA